MSEESIASVQIPVLTDVVEDPLELEAPTDAPDTDSISDREMLVAELQTELSVGAFTLTEQLLHSAISEMEATLFEQVLNRLRQELPELVDTVLREHLIDEEDDD